MPRAGLTTASVVREAADLTDEVGYDGLTLTMLAARLHVAVPSLYKHIGSLGDLRRSIAVAAVDELGTAMRDALRDAGGGTSRLQSLAGAFRDYARAHPGRYAATVRAASPEDLELQAASDRTLEPVFGVLEAGGLHGDGLVHAARGLRSALHGFVTLEGAGGFGLPQDVDRSFERMVQDFEAGLAVRADRG